MERTLTLLTSMMLIAGLILFFIQGVLALADLVDKSVPATVAVVAWWIALAYLASRTLKKES